MAKHLVAPVAAGLGCRPLGQPPPGHEHQHAADVRNVRDGLQGVVHQGLLRQGETRPGRAVRALAGPPHPRGQAWPRTWESAVSTLTLLVDTKRSTSVMG